MLKFNQQVCYRPKVTLDLQFKHDRTRELLPRFVGPSPVTRLLSPAAYKLKLPKNVKLHDDFHVSLLKPYKSDGSVQPPPPPEVMVMVSLNMKWRPL